MRHFLAIIMCIGSLTLHAADTNAPVIKVDNKHKMMNYPAGTKPETYRVHASPSIILDASGFSFDVLPELRDKSLDSIQIVQSKTNQFEMKWQSGKTRYELSKETLQLVPGSKPFEGFKAGDRVVVAIGVKLGSRDFAPVWTSIIEIE